VLGLALKEEGTLAVDRFTLETSRPLLCRGRCHHRRIEHVQRHERGKQAARKIDERLVPEREVKSHAGSAVPRIRIQPPGAGEPSLSRRHQATSLSPRQGTLATGSMPPQPSGGAEECRRCCAAIYESHQWPSNMMENERTARVEQNHFRRIDGELVTAHEGDTILEAARATEEFPRSAT